MKKRAQIEILLRAGMPKTKIARMVDVSRSMRYNELKRGTVVRMDADLRPYMRYFGDAGQRIYEERRKNGRPSLKLV